MEIRIKVNKQVLCGASIVNLKKRIALDHVYTRGVININSGKHISFSGLASFRSENTIRVYNIEKKNAKRVRGFNGSYKKISETFYTAYIYDIPIDLLKLSGLSVEQKTRHFVLKKEDAPVRK